MFCGRKIVMMIRPVANHDATNFLMLSLASRYHVE